MKIYLYVYSEMYIENYENEFACKCGLYVEDVDIDAIHVLTVPQLKLSF